MCTLLIIVKRVTPLVGSIFLITLLPARAGAQAVTAEAYTGAPLGVGRISAPVGSTGANVMVRTRAFALNEQDNRVLYPVFATDEWLTQVLQTVTGRDTGSARTVTAYFVFRGTEPLQLSLQSPTAHELVVTPIAEPRRHARHLRLWWRRYHRMISRQRQEGDYPPIVQTYLSTTLANRLGVARPLVAEPAPIGFSEPRQALEMVLGTEQLRDAVMRETLRGAADQNQSADNPVPAEPDWPRLRLPESTSRSDIEPIALHVPEECFYVRFGSFENYLWLTHLLKEYGGDISSMVRLRGHDRRLSQRAQRQLALKESALAPILGGQVIADVALIGRDMFLAEGAAIGILFQARNALLAADIERQRNEALAAERQNGAVLESLQIAGRDVSFLSTPGNELRSFYAVDGDYHLVTTSRAIVRRFFAAGRGEGSLGGSAEFAHARSAMPLGRDDTVFVYLSSRFVQGLASPQYQIELRRRVKAVTDLELVQLARWSARAEGKPAETVQELIDAGLLPSGFLSRPDNSHVVLGSERTLADSLRGRRGTFLPVPDVPLVGVTRQEANRYTALATFSQAHWHQTDPLMIGIQRVALDQPGRERVSVDAWMVPFHALQYGLVTSLIGPPIDSWVTPAPGDIVSVQAVLKGGLLRPEIATHHVFLGLQDIPAPRRLPEGSILQGLTMLMTAPGYLGAWPEAGLLDLLPVPLASEPDALGYSRLPLGLWRRQRDEFSVLSFAPPVLESVTPHLRVEKTDSHAQVRIRAGDLGGAKISGWLNQLYYQRAGQTSIGNARFLHTLSQQLHVPRAQAREVAEELLDVKLMCALGGEYQLENHLDGLSHWTSSAWRPRNEQLDEQTGYRAPILQWFGGLDAELSMREDRLFLHAELEIERKRRAGIKSPLLDLFGD